MAGKIIKGVSGLVGLGQEAYQHHQDQKAAEKAAAEQAAHEPLTDSKHEHDIDEDEDDWIADDAQDHLQPVESDRSSETPDKVIDWFLKRHPPPDKSAPPSQGHLPAPVIVPQKHPGSRTRGFVRAYAPALAECGVDQAAFLDFLDGFQKEMKKQKYFNVANLGVAISVLSYTAAVAPNPFVELGAIAVHLSVETGRRLYVSKKTNTYLDDMNAQYFQPHGLYALIMSYKPNSPDLGETLDLELASATAIDQRTHAEKSTWSGFKASSGKTVNQQIPECCPLVFPKLDKATAEQKENAFKRAIAFVGDYYDKRAQAKFAAHDPNSRLNVQEHTFAGKYADPTTFEHSGIVGNLTGGAVDPSREKWERKQQRREQKRANRGADDGPHGPLGLIGVAKRAFGEGVLYLLVVNTPSEQQLQAAEEAEERMRREVPDWYEKY